MLAAPPGSSQVGGHTTDQQNVIIKLPIAISVVRFVTVAAFVALLSALLPSPAEAWTQPSTLEARLAEDAFARINDERVARGVPALRWDPALAQAAGEWSQHMARTGQFSHRALAGLWEAPWELDYQALGENLARGSAGVTIGRLHGGLMASDKHRPNMLDPGFHAVGLGVVCDAAGGIWLTQNFGRSPGSSSPPVGSVNAPLDPQARTDSGAGCSTSADSLPEPRLAHHRDGGGTTAAAPARIAAPAHACSAERAPVTSGFVDSVRSPHDAAIACVVWWGLAVGTAPGTFDPAAPVTRAQMARFITRLVDVAGVEAPTTSVQTFTDIDGSVHADAITRLAALGLATGVSTSEYAPSGPVRRDQMASFLARAYELAAARTLPAPSAPFLDHYRSVHRTSIDKAAAAEFAAGTSAVTYSPERPVRRDQMATFLARVLDALVREGLVAPPA
jgi:uncharacterized protein YkwD